MSEIRPQPGPQTLFASCSADIAIFGGAAGGGKSWALAAEGVRVAAHGGSAVIFRRTSVELTGGGSIWEEASAMYSAVGATLRQHPVLDARFDAGGLVEFRHLQYEKDVYDHQGKQYDFVGFDELTHFTERQFWYLYSRLRTRTAGMRPYVRGTCNPDPDSFVRTIIDWWIGEDGYPIPERAGIARWFVRENNDLHWSSDPNELRRQFSRRPQSITFIPAKLSDNAILMERDPEYRDKLMALDDVERERLLGGNWNVRDTSTRVYRYLASRNLRPLPMDYDRERWVHTLGVDFGMSDETAWVVLASHPHRREVWMVHADKQGGLLPDEAAERTKRLYDLYRPDRIVGDAGGLGKPYVEAHNRRFPGAPMRPADKQEKRAHIELLNGDLMAGRFLAADGGVCQPWIAEVQVLPWADERRLDEHKAYANHCADAALYAYRAHLSYLHEAPKPIAPTRRRIDDPALEDEEAQRLIDAARRPWWAEDEF